MSKALENKLELLATMGIHDLRKALTDRNNFYVGKAARRAAALNAIELIDPLRDSFARFLAGSSEADPKCWAKVDIVQALFHLGYIEPGIYKEAFSCVQMENVWGGKQDSASPLRALAALALVNCNIDPVDLLRTLLRGLTDPAKNVRIETIRALTRLGRWEGELLLRQKALAGDPDTEVIGNAFSAILELDQQDAIGFVAAFLQAESEAIVLEAAASLAQSRHQQAFAIVTKLWQSVLSTDMRRTIVISLGASPLDEAKNFLLNIIEGQSIEQAVWAVTALAGSRHREEVRQQVTALVDSRRDRELAQALREEFG